MLSIREISRSFSLRGLVLDKLSLDVEEGQTVSVMGPSGSGKTTLLNIIGLLDKPDGGRVYFRGNPVDTFSENEAARYRSANIGFVFQDHLLLNYLTVNENIMLPLIAAGYNDETARKREKELKQLMEHAGISALGNKYPYQISGGEAQRVALIRALANKPSIILADEPTGSLDAANAELLGNLLIAINKETGTSIITATHSPELAGKMSVKLLLKQGKLFKS